MTMNFKSIKLILSLTASLFVTHVSASFDVEHPFTIDFSKQKAFKKQLKGSYPDVLNMVEGFHNVVGRFVELTQSDEAIRKYPGLGSEFRNKLSAALSDSFVKGLCGDINEISEAAKDKVRASNKWEKHAIDIINIEENCLIEEFKKFKRTLKERLQLRVYEEAHWYALVWDVCNFKNTSITKRHHFKEGVGAQIKKLMERTGFVEFDSIKAYKPSAYLDKAILKAISSDRDVIVIAGCGQNRGRHAFEKFGVPNPTNCGNCDESHKKVITIDMDPLAMPTIVADMDDEGIMEILKSYGLKYTNGFCDGPGIIVTY